MNFYAFFWEVFKNGETSAEIQLFIIKLYLILNILMASLTYPQVNRRVTVHENQGSRERWNGKNKIDKIFRIFCYNPLRNTIHEENSKERERPHSTNNEVGEMPTSVEVFDGVEDAGVSVNSHRDQVEDGSK